MVKEIINFIIENKLFLISVGITLIIFQILNNQLTRNSYYNSNEKESLNDYNYLKKIVDKRQENALDNLYEEFKEKVPKEKANIVLTKVGNQIKKRKRLLTSDKELINYIIEELDNELQLYR